MAACVQQRLVPGNAEAAQPIERAAHHKHLEASSTAPVKRPRLAEHRGRTTRCSHCVTCCVPRHSLGPNSTSEEFQQWWPMGLRTPSAYYSLGSRQLARCIWQASQRPDGLWRPAADLSAPPAAPSPLRQRRGLPPLAVSVPASFTNISKDASDVTYVRAVMVALPRRSTAISWLAAGRADPGPAAAATPPPPPLVVLSPPPADALAGHFTARVPMQQPLPLPRSEPIRCPPRRAASQPASAFGSPMSISCSGGTRPSASILAAAQRASALAVAERVRQLQALGTVPGPSPTLSTASSLCFRTGSGGSSSGSGLEDASMAHRTSSGAGGSPASSLASPADSEGALGGPRHHCLELHGDLATKAGAAPAAHCAAAGRPSRRWRSMLRSLMGAGRGVKALVSPRSVV